MRMAKRNINYIKPEDPKFLRLLKQEAGYSDKNPKFDKFENSPDDFVDDDESEQPQVVVLNPGDLTAEEAAAEKEKLVNDAEETKADLTQKIVFKSSKSKEPTNERKRNVTTSKDKNDKTKKSKSQLSFDIEEEEED